MRNLWEGDRTYGLDLRIKLQRLVLRHNFALEFLDLTHDYADDKVHQQHWFVWGGMCVCVCVRERQKCAREQF